MQAPFADELLSSIKKQDSVYFRTLISIISTSLRREENILFTYSPEDGIAPESITTLIDYIIMSIIPLSFSITDSSGKTIVPEKRRSKSIVRPGRRDKSSYGTTGNQELIRIENQSSANPSPFSTNIAMFESFNTYPNLSSVYETTSRLTTIFGKEECTLAVPFVLIGIVPANTHLDPKYLKMFTYSFHFNEVPMGLPQPATPFFQQYSSFVPEKPLNIYANRDIITYISKLILRVECTPLADTYLNVETKLLLEKTAEELALLSGRNFIIPDDIQELFPCLVSHRYKLPVTSTFETCHKHALESMCQVDIPIY